MINNNNDFIYSNSNIYTTLMFKKIIIFLAITLTMQVFICYANWNIRDIPFKNVWDTGLSTNFNPIKTGDSTVRKDLTFLENIILQAIQFMKTLLWTLTILFCVYWWFLMTTAQWDEWKIKKWKVQLKWWLIALLLIFMVDPLIRKVFFWWWWWILPWEAIYNPNAIKQWVLEIEWFISYMQTFIALIAVYEMLSEWAKMIFSLDKDDSYKNVKKTIIWIWIGIILIFLSKIFVYYWVLWNPVTWEERNLTKVVSESSATIKYLLWFIATISVFTLVYWWFRMITSFWWDWNKEWKNIIVNMAIWVTIIIISYVLVSTIILSNT